jgi:Asp-tRNA(Asn)/Glu-tRNA(Gln) amidotransferase C subunit
MARLSEEEKELIKKESQQLVTEFSRKLEKIRGELNDSPASSESRKEENGWETEQSFKEALFQNAPLVEDDLIIAEKGVWKK